MNVGETYKASWNVTSSNSFKFTMHLQIKLVSQDYVNNTSKVTIYYGLACSSSGDYLWGGSYTPTLRVGFKNHNASTYTLSPTQTVRPYTAGYNTSYESATYKYSYTWDVPHNDDGTLSLDTEYVWVRGPAGGKGGPYIPLDSTHSVTGLSIPQIPRQNKFTVSPSILQSGDTMSITVTKEVDAYTSTVRYRVNEGDWKVLGTKDAGTSFSDSYDNVAARLTGGASTGDVEIEVTTYSGDTQIGTTETKHIGILTGTLPFSLYDDRSGNIGATVGREAEGPGFNVFLDTTLGDSVERVDIDARNSKTWDVGTNNEYGIPEYKEGDRWACNIGCFIFPGYVDNNNAENGVIFGITLPGSLTNINRITVDHIDAYCYFYDGAVRLTSGRVFTVVPDMHNPVMYGVQHERNRLRMKALGNTGHGNATMCNVCASLVLTFHES